MMLFTEDLILNIPGLTRPKLNHWNNVGIVRPRISSGARCQGGMRRIYSQEQALAVMLLLEFRKRGIGAQSIPKIVRPIQYLVRHGIPRWLVYGGEKITGCRNFTEVLKISSAHYGSVIVVETLEIREAKWLRGERAA